MSIANGFVVKALVFVLLGIALLFLEAECARRGLGDLADIADGKTVGLRGAGKTLDDGGSEGGNQQGGDENGGYGQGGDGQGGDGQGGDGQGSDGQGGGGKGSGGNGGEGGGSSSGYNVNSYGAKADGQTNSAQAFIKAWDAACKSGGSAKVLIPSGSYVAGPVVFAGPCQGSKITLEIQGTVKATSDLSDYPSAEWFSIESVDGLIITGTGTLDGQGASVWKYNDCKISSDCSLLPSTISLSKIKNADVSGIHLLNSKSFHIIMSFSDYVKMHGLKITAPGDSPNTDGIHVSTSSNVDIYGIAVGTGDDCISIGHGSTQITISDVTCGPGHGISIGSLGKYSNEKDVSGVSVTHCTLKDTMFGVRIKTWEGSEPSKASDITFEDVGMTDVGTAIVINQKYGALSNSPSKVAISDVHFKNIWGTTTDNVPVQITCSTSVPCQGVEVADINLKYSGNKDDSSIKSTCTNADMTCEGKQIPPICSNYN